LTLLKVLHRFFFAALGTDFCYVVCAGNGPRERSRLQIVWNPAVFAAGTDVRDLHVRDSSVGVVHGQ
jgi:hypothetical protein